MLKIDAANLIFTIVNLLVLFVALKVILFKPVQKIIAERQKLADQSLDDAAKSKAEAEKVQAECNEQLANIEQSRKAALSEARKEADEQYKKIVEEANVKARKIEEDATTDAEKKKQEIIESAKKDIADMVVSAASKVVAGKSGADVDAALYDEFLDKAGD